MYWSCDCASVAMADTKCLSLRAMNNDSVKYGEWIVRILFPSVEQYDVNTRSGKEKAKRFECRVVAKDEDEY